MSSQEQQQSSSHGGFSLPTGPRFHSSSRPSTPSRTQQKKARKSASISSLHSTTRGAHERSTATSITPAAAAAEDPEPTRYPRDLARPASSEMAMRTSDSADKWWHIHYFQGMIGDIKRRAPYYASDWKDAWDYRVVPATVYMYFA
ncbi:hypothetical protein AJ78_07906, partial [Emergomyces pasteurianus Ep9510]